mgnify:CR=1 FL=1
MNQDFFPYRSAMLDSSDIDYIECKGAVFVRIRDVRKSIAKALKYPARIESFVMLYCSRGRLSFSAKLQELEMTENTFFGVAHSLMQFKDCSDDCELYALSFSQEFGTQMNIDSRHIFPLVSIIDNSPKVHSTPKELQVAIERGFNRMLESSAEMKGSQVPYADLAVAHLFTSILYSFCTLLAVDVEKPLSIPAKNRTTEYFERLLRLLGEHYKTERSVEFYADKMSLTPKHLSRVVRSHSGRSVHQWIDAFVVQEIKNYVCNKYTHIDEEIVKKEAEKEIVRRYYQEKVNYKKGQVSIEVVDFPLFQ